MSNKHQPHDLKQMQSMPLEIKIDMTKRRIQEWYEHWDGMVYVSFSGGKDSTVLKHIVDSMYDDVPSLFVNTGLEYPEIQKFAMSQKNVVTVRPEMRFDEVIKKYGYPVVSKEVSKYIKEARAALKKGNQNYYALQKLKGELKDKNGEKSRYNCAECTSFVRIKPQYCARCGGTFYERQENRFCKTCRVAKKKTAQRKWARENRSKG